jgi:glycosyltransferase involved in cell wall biosynthesis
MARVSLCLIAKDEERLLPGCLESVRGVADEIVLVDTGSTDRTRELARAAGAKVLERPWDDDFAAPRNLAAAHATGDWILPLDADERLAPGSGPALRRALRRAAFDVGMVRCHNADAPDAPLTATEAAALQDLMRAVVTDGGGRLLADAPGAPVLAKTGTAQAGSGADLHNHAWMIAAQGDLAVAVFVEDGEYGSTTAGPLLEQFLLSVPAIG